MTNPKYMLDNGMGHDGAGFVKEVQELYKENKDRLPGVKRPTSIKASIAVAKKLGRKVYYKEDGWRYSEI